MFFPSFVIQSILALSFQIIIALPLQLYNKTTPHISFIIMPTLPYMSQPHHHNNPAISLQNHHPPQQQHHQPAQQAQQQLSNNNVLQKQEENLIIYDHSKPQTRLTKAQTTYIAVKQVQQYRKVSQNIQIMNRLKKANSQKQRKLQKNVSNLNFLSNLSFKQTLKIQTQRTKLQQTQSLAIFLNKLQQQKNNQEQQQLTHRRSLCLSLRQSNSKTKQLSHSFFNSLKESRVRQFKELNEHLLETHERNLENLLEENRRRAHSTRVSEQRLREKLKKYQEYKVYIGRMNYERKLFEQKERSKINRRYLKEIEKDLKEEDKLFRKTQKLKKQSKRIEEFYLTGTGAD